MDFSGDQKLALEKCEAWVTGKTPKVFKLYGCAGTGKTTLAKHLAKLVGRRVYFTAFTGKAAEVLQRAGCPNARTIHSLIYIPKEKGKKRLTALELEMTKLPNDAPPELVEDLQRRIEEERENLDRPSFKLNSESEMRFASLVVVDECSMVDGQMGEDLLSFGVPILALGDPGQLPPVGGRSFFAANTADHTLTEIHRQAKGSPILKLATMARLGEKIPYGDYGDGCRVVEKITPQEAVEADQIICGRNSKRRAINMRVRKLLGYEDELPVAQDKLICLRNNHDEGLLNGGQWIVESSELLTGDSSTLDLHQLGFPENKIFTTSHNHYFQGKTSKDISPWLRADSNEFDYGYAVTCHKAQGSQWDNVIIFDESFCFRDDRHKWLYTAITRAAKTVTLVRDR